MVTAALALRNKCIRCKPEFCISSISRSLCLEQKLKRWYFCIENSIWDLRAELGSFGWCVDMDLKNM